jgi:hypothetical protein
VSSLKCETKMASSPICLLQWLRPGEYREIRASLQKFAAEINIKHSDVQTEEQASQALKSWFQGSVGNAQFCFIGAHGLRTLRGTTVGIGATGRTGGHASWRELWNWFAREELIGGLWLGACRSSEAAAALSPLLATAVRPAIPYIYGFKDEIYPAPEIEQILLKLIEFTRMDPVVWLDEELKLLRAAVPGTAIELYYPASTSPHRVEYLNVDQLPARMGITFRQLLERQNSVGTR